MMRFNVAYNLLMGKVSGHIDEWCCFLSRYSLRSDASIISHVLTRDRVVVYVRVDSKDFVAKVDRLYR